jgi:hypothetical protein
VNEQPQEQIIEALQLEAADIANVRIEPLFQTIETENSLEANQISDQHNATMVIYGTLHPGGITTWFHIKSQHSYIHYRPEGPFRVPIDQVSDLRSYVYKGTDWTYVVSLIVGQLHYFEDDCHVGGNCQRAIDAL